MDLRVGDILDPDRKPLVLIRVPQPSLDPGAMP